MRQWLADLRQKKEWNKAQTAKKLGVTRQYYGGIESGDRMKRLSIILKVTDLLLSTKN